MNRDEYNNLVEKYGGGYDLFAVALAQVPREAWEFKSSPDEWSVHETVVHMADSETIGALRVRKLIAEPGGTLMGYDDDEWAKALNYKDQSMDDALQFFMFARQTTYHILKSLPDQVFTYAVIHPEAVHPEHGADYTLEKWLNIYIDHIRDHIEQLQKNHQAWKDHNK